MPIFKLIFLSKKKKNQNSRIKFKIIVRLVYMNAEYRQRPRKQNLKISEWKILRLG